MHMRALGARARAAAVAAAAFAYGPFRTAAGRLLGAPAVQGDRLRCEYGGKTYLAGEQRRADDGCNVCACGRGGWSCTKIFCPAGSGSFGTISGEIGPPSGAAVPAQRVCAVSLKDDREYCQQTTPDQRIYALQAPAGDYWVYASPLRSDAARRAYFSSYERCGEKLECKDHSPVTVSVEPGQIVKADPKDWSPGGQIEELNVTPSKFQYGIHEYYPASAFLVRGRGLSGVRMFYTPWPPEDDDEEDGEDD